MRSLNSGIFLLLTSVAVAQAAQPFMAIERLPLTRPATKGVQVEVLDSDREPVGGASVGLVSAEWLHDPKAKALRSTLDRVYGEDLFLKLGLAGKYGTRFRSDQDGQVTLPNDAEGYLVAIWVEGGKRFAVTKDLHTGTEEVTLELAALEELVVRVVDERGRPVSRMPVSTENSRGEFNNGRDVVGWTNRNGFAYLRQKWLPSLDGDSLRVGVAFVGDESVVKAVDIREGLPEDVVELQMPPFGQIKTILYDKDGKPSTRVARAAIRIVERFDRRSNYGRWEAPMAEPDGATFPAVGLNQDFKIELTLEDPHQQVTVEGAGPRKPREMTVLTSGGRTKVVIGPTLVMRVLDLSGEPVKEEELGIAFMDADHARGLTSRTDTEGRLVVAVPLEHYRSDDVRVYIMRRGPGTDSVSLGGMAITLPQNPPSGRFELGDRRLEEEPVQLAGRVVDEEGRPVRGVEIKVGRVFRRPRSSWSGSAKLLGHVAHTDADGRFELRHVFDELTNLEVTLGGYYIQEMSDWSVGDADLEVVLAPLGMVSASIKNTPNRSVHLTLENDAEPNQRWDGWAYPRNGEANVRVSWEVPPGTYKLYLGPVDSENLIVDEIQVEIGKVAEDERLVGLDWTQYMTEITVKVVDEQGQSVPQAMVWFYRKTGGGWGGNGTPLSDDRQTVSESVSKGESVVVYVEAKGFAAFLAEEVKQDLDVVMVKLQRLEVRLDGDLELPDEMRLGITLVQEMNHQEMVTDVPVRIGPQAPEAFHDGVARPAIHGHAECEVRLTLMRAKREGEWQPKQVRISHELPNFKVTEETLREGLKIHVDDDLKDEIEGAVEQLRLP